MDQTALSVLLARLVSAGESEVVEFKEAKTQFDSAKLGRYFSALANEANLRGCESGWLVFGVADDGSVVGTSYRSMPAQLQRLKQEIAEKAEPRATFREIHELQHPNGRVLLFEIPSAPAGIPIAWNGYHYARNGESLGALDFTKLDEIRAQTADMDWSAGVLEDATFDDLDPKAVNQAREAYILKAGARVSADEVRSWPMQAFTDRVGLTIGGKVTRTALLLVGRPESAWRLSPHPAQLTWSLEGPETAYEHFKPPFLAATSDLFQRIRNVQIRLLPPDQLVATEVSKYDQRVVLEALHNCIAHQDYRRSARVVVRELPDRLIFENEGSFFDGEPDQYVPGIKRPRRYRNAFLAQAMAELNMIDTLGYGIHQMNRAQAARYLPLPTYDLKEPDSVRLTVFGGVVDPKYTAVLLAHTDLAFEDVLVLDRIQKQLPIPDDALSRLRRKKLVEGRRPHLRVTAHIAEASDTKADYIRTRAQDDAHYTKLVSDYLEQFGAGTRRELNHLLWDKLSDVLTDEQKGHKVSNLLSKMRRSGVIENSGSRARPRWTLTQGSPKEGAPD